MGAWARQRRTPSTPGGDWPQSSGSAASIASVSSRQCDYWCSTGLIPGQPLDVGSGQRRTFTRHQVACLALLRDLPVPTSGDRQIRKQAVEVAIEHDFTGWLLVGRAVVIWSFGPPVIAPNWKVGQIVHLAAYLAEIDTHIGVAA